MGEIVDRIIQLMQKKHMTAKKLSEIIGVSPNAVSEWKTGRIKPSIEHIIKIAQVFDVSTDYILTGVDRDALKKESLIGAYDVLDGGEVTSTAEEEALVKLRANDALTKRIEEMFKELAQKDE